MLYEVITMYYYQGITTEAIANLMEFSRPKVSRLLNRITSYNVCYTKLLR